MTLTEGELAALFAEPAEAGRSAVAARAAHLGRRVFVRPAPHHPAPTVALVLRGSERLDFGPGPRDPVPPDMNRAPGSQDPVPSDMISGTGSNGHAPHDMRSGSESAEQATRAAAGDPGWPAPESLRPGDRAVVQVDPERAAAYFAWLLRLAAAAPAGVSVAPFCARPGGLFRLHLLAAARIALPGGVRVEARHDLLGVRLAQIALGFGADTLAGPLAPARRLPLAGVTRPDETNAAALATLVEQAGYEPVLVDISPEDPA